MAIQAFSQLDKIDNMPLTGAAAYVRRSGAGFGAFLSVALLLLALASVARAETLSEHGPWAALKETESTGPVCYIGAEPSKQEGNYTRRGDTYVLVMHRPQQNENDVVSVRAGYTYKSGRQVQIRVDGGKPAELFTKDTHAWTYDTQSDKALVQAMKRGSNMVVTGTSSLGTLTTDTYSLSGFTAAYNDAKAACGF